MLIFAQIRSWSALNGYQFIASLIDSLAWPVAAIVVVWILRRALLALLPRLRFLKYKDWHLEFSELLEAAETQIGVAQKDTETITARRRNSEEPHVVEFSDAMIPSQIVITVWQQVEAAILKLAISYGGKFDSKSSLPTIFRFLERRRVIDKSLRKLLETLYAARNAAAHSYFGGVSGEEARRYARTVHQVLRRLPPMN